MPLTAEELGKRIAEGRENAKLTQQQVADALGIPRSAVSLIEAGQRQVTGLELMKLAEIFGTEVRDLVEGKPDVRALFRMEPALAGAGVQSALDDTLPLCEVISELEDMIAEAEGRIRKPWRGQDIPIVRSAIEEQGQELARIERERLNLGFGPIGDLAAVLFSQGIAVAEHRLPEGLSGLFLHVRDRPFILVNAEEIGWRRRFSIAHEYGHALVDASLRVIVSRVGDESARERRANAFAGAFLMPKEGILQFTESLGVSPESMDFTKAVALANHFGVSYDAAVVQLYQQRVVSLKQKRALEAKSNNARGVRGKLNVKEPAGVRTTLAQWALLKMGRAYELESISTRRALAIGRMLGQDEERTREHLAMFGATPTSED